MVKASKYIKGKRPFIDLPTGRVYIGPNAVPNSKDSVSKTSVKELVKTLRQASKDRIFEPTYPINVTQ